MRHTVALFLAAFFAFTGFAQKPGKSISGQVVDLQNEPIGGALVQLQRLSDSSFVQTVITKENGKFQLQAPDSSSYRVTVTALGNKKYVSAALAMDSRHTSLVLPVIVLLPEKQAALKEVTVLAKKPLIEQEIDKTVVNVDAMISSATSNALEVLEKTPGVMVERNGDISLNGKSGAMVLIEGRPTYMSATDLAAYLRSIPGSTIDKIELMDNPPAKYDAAGSALINIRLKRNKKQGINGSMSLSYMQGKMNSTYNSLNLNYLRKKLNVFGSLNVNMDSNFDQDNTDRIYFNEANVKTGSTVLDNYYSYKVKDITIRTGLDYTFSPNTTIGFIISTYARNKNDNLDSRNYSYDANGNENDSSGYGNTVGGSKWRQVNANMNLQHKFNQAGREISADMNYIRYKNAGDRVLDNYIYRNGYVDSFNTFQYYLPSDIDIYNFKADYIHPLKSKIVLSGGFKTSFVRNASRSDYSEIINNKPEPVPARSNEFVYSENINAVYINGKKDWNRLGVQLGLRVENTNTRGEQPGNSVIPDSTNSKQYTGLFPSVFLTYKLDSTGKNSITLRYARRINRPGYQQLNPFLIFIDQYSYIAGNPFLLPSVNNNFEFSYRYKQFATFTFEYNDISNAYFNASRSEGKLFITRPENAEGRYMMAVFMNLNFSLTKWWKLNFNAGGANFVTRGTVYDQSLDQRMYAYRFNINNQFSISKNWSGEISGRYTSSVINLQRIYSPRYQANMAVQKKIMKGKGSLKLNVDDIFYTLRQKEQVTGLQGASAWHMNVFDSRRVGIAFNYNFGKEAFSRKRRYNDNGADDVKGRVD